MDKRRCFNNDTAPPAPPILTLPSPSAMKISSLSLFSSNETLADVQTPYLKFLMLPFYKMLCLMGVPTDGAVARLANVRNAVGMGVAYLTSVEKLGGIMEEDELATFHKVSK